MSVNFRQYCLYGIEIEEDDICTVVSPEVTEDQPRYDRKTGKVEKYETVVVKDEIKSYAFMGCKTDSFYELYEELYDKLVRSTDGLYDVELIGDDYGDSRIYIGCRIGHKKDLGRVDLLYDNADMSLKYLQDCHNQMIEDGFNEEDLRLQLFYDVG